jgi:hypothetical protein
VLNFRITSSIVEIQVIARGRQIRELRRLIKAHGKGRWRKLKGTATIELPDGRIRKAEIHWYEAHGLGKKEIKIKRFLA